MSQNVSQSRSDRGQFFDTLKRLNNELQDEIHRQESAVKKLEQEIHDLRFCMSTLKKENTTLQQKLNNQDLEISLLKKEIVNLQAAARLMKEQYDAKERDYDAKESEFYERIINMSHGKTQAEKLVNEKQRFIEEMQTALKDITLGLGKLVGATVTYTSPDFADGSDDYRPTKPSDAFSEPGDINHSIGDLLYDQDRPTKLAEEFSELYDIEWTDAFENIEMETEKEKTGFMLNILKRARNLCLETSRDHMFEIKNSFAVLNMQNSEEEGTNFEYIDSITTTRTVAVQTPVYTKLLANFRYLSKEQEKTILEIRNVFEQRLSESFLRIGTDMIVKEFKIEEHDTVVYYVRKCMTICWSMCRHEPPVHIEFSENGENQPYVTNIFKPYTKTGKFLDFVVWPALFLYENGPLLAKGVAEGRK